MADQDRPDDGEARRDDDGALSRQALEAWSASEVPDGFAERVLARAAAAAVAVPLGDASAGERSAPAPRRRRRPLIMAAALVGVACAAAFGFAVLRGPDLGPGARGELSGAGRQQLTLGRRGVAVAETGAAMSWTVQPSGATRVAQTAGNVFYRVDRGGPFTVSTPAGTVEVTGTCFRVEVVPPASGDRALTALVTVYEGRVQLADDHGSASADAGEHAVLGDLTGPVVADATSPSRPGIEDTDADRATLLARDAEQRATITALRAQLAALAQTVGADVNVGSAGVRHDPDGAPWFDPSPATLQTMAKECRVRFDIPPGLRNLEAADLGAEQFGMRPEEVGPVNEAMSALHERWLAQMRELYLAATGDSAGAETLSPDAMAQEIQDKSDRAVAAAVQTRLAREHAGLAEPPADLGALTPIERYFRMLATVGDETELAIAARIGAERARALREHHQGWGMSMEMIGCHDDHEGER